METPHLPIKGHISILHLLLDIVFLALLAATIYFGIRHYQGQERIRYLEDRVEQFSSSEKIVDFLDLFIAKILKGEQDISFEERLEMENHVRDLHDPEILAHWNRFTKAENDVIAQESVKDLLQILTRKIFEND